VVRSFILHISPHLPNINKLTGFIDSSTVIAHIQEQCKNEPNSAVVYWYFTFRDSASQKVDQCLRSLVTNLCSKRRDTPKALQEVYEQANNGQLSPSTKSLMAMLNSVIDGFEHVYIFLDALDECPKSGKERERDELLERLHEICSWKKDCLHVLTTSRKERDIEDSLLDLSSKHENFKIITVQGAHVEQDIKKYIRNKLDARQFKGWKAELKVEVEIKLASQADGMYVAL
jgi:ankyrin repeat domain-containing protein 50